MMRVVNTNITGVYGGYLDKIPFGSAINRGLTFRMAQTPVQHYLPKLLKLIEEGKIDPSVVITDRASLEEGPELYKKFRDKKDGCIKVVLKPSRRRTLMARRYSKSASKDVKGAMHKRKRGTAQERQRAQGEVP